MLIKDIETWVANGIAYWDNYLETQRFNLKDQEDHSQNNPFTNKAALMAQITSDLNAFITAVNNYKADDTRLSNLKDTMFSMITYISCRFTESDPAGPLVPDAVTGNDVRNWFKYYSYNLADNAYESFYSFDDVLNDLGTGTCTGGVGDETDQATCESNGGSWQGDFESTTEGSLVINASRGALMDTINGFLQNDKDIMSAFPGIVPPIIRDRMIFLMFARPDTLPGAPPPDEQLLKNMHLFEVLQDHGWSIEGVEWNPDWGEAPA